MITKLNYLLLIYFVCLIIFAPLLEMYMWFVRRARYIFALCWSGARVLHYSAAAGASAGGRAKPAEACAANRFFARGA